MGDAAQSGARNGLGVAGARVRAANKPAFCRVPRDGPRLANSRSHGSACPEPRMNDSLYQFYFWVESTPYATWIRESGSLWAYPIVLTLHTVGLAMLVGFNWAINLRLLGFASSVPVMAMERFFKVMWWGFWINLVSGVILLMADATTKMTSWVFGVKMIFIVAGMIILRRIQVKVFHLPDLDKFIPQNAKVMAAVSLGCWVLATTAGRLMAYLGPQVGLNGPQIR